MPRSEFDAVIVGAGPAGSAAAIEFARSGQRVLVVDKHTFPRDKVCGGCLSGTAVKAVRALLDGRRPLPGAPGRRLTFVIGRHRLTCEAHGTTWIASRNELDDCLVETARDAGAMLRLGAAASLELHDDRWQVVVDGERIAARHVLIASGIGALALKLGLRGRQFGRAMVAQQWVQPQEAALPRLGEVELHWLRGGYVGLCSWRPGECVVALAARLPAGSRVSGFEHLRRLNPAAPVMSILPADAPRRFGARGTAGFPWLPARVADRNALLIGDAAGYAEPYTGEGIAQALGSAALAVKSILAGGDAARAYVRRMGGVHRRVFWRARIMSLILQRETIHRLADRCAHIPTGLFSRMIAHVHVGPREGRHLWTAAGKWGQDSFVRSTLRAVSANES